MVAAAIMIFVVGIGVGVLGTVGVAAVSRHFHHGPAAVGPDWHRKGPQPPRFAPNQRPLRPGLPARPGLPVQPAQPTQPSPSATG